MVFLAAWSHVCVRVLAGKNATQMKRVNIPRSVKDSHYRYTMPCIESKARLLAFCAVVAERSACCAAAGGGSCVGPVERLHTLKRARPLLLRALFLR